MDRWTLKRRATPTGAPASLSPGEIATNLLDNRTWIGDASGVPREIGNSSGFLGRQIFGTAGAANYAPAANVRAALVIVTGGGGAGGSVAAGTVDFVSVGGGGAGGSTAIRLIMEPKPATLFIGDGGVVVADAAGADGEASSYSDGTYTLDALGGGGGAGGTGNADVNLRQGGIGGTPTGGQYNIRGDDGGSGVCYKGTTAPTFYVKTNLMVPRGGGSYWGESANCDQAQNIANDTGAALDGTIGGVRGAGGSGSACVRVSGTNLQAQGGRGNPGVIVIYEFG